MKLYAWVCELSLFYYVNCSLFVLYMKNKLSDLIDCLGGGGVLTCICRDTRTCHYFGYFFGGAPGFWVSFWTVPGFLGIIFLVKLICLGITQIFGY